MVENLKAQGVDAAAHTLDDIAVALGNADVVVACTGAVRPVVSLADAHRGLMNRPEHRQLVICDLGMPRDVDGAIAGLPGVHIAALALDDAGASAEDLLIEDEGD